MQILDGRKLAAKIRQEVKAEIKRLGLNPGLAVILVGDNPASHLYVGLKEKAAREVGIHFEKYIFPSQSSHTPPLTPPPRGGEKSVSSPFEGEVRRGPLCGCQSCVLAKIQELNERPDIHGILVQVPLPKNYAEDVVIAQIDPKKDVDGFHQTNLRAILAGAPKIFPAVALGIMALIDDALRSTGSPSAPQLNAILIVNRMEFAAPLEYLLEQRRAEVQILLRQKTITPAVATQLKTADVLVIARGHANFVNGSMLKTGAIVIDAGTNKLPDGRTVGDVDYNSTQDNSGFITPVPGGVGPMTVAMLLKNVLELTK